MRRAPVSLLVALGAGAALAGCGTAAPDLFVLRRSGAIPGAELVLRVTDDGFVRCNGGPRRQMPSRLLIDARVLVDDLAAPAKAGRSLPPARGTILRYQIRTTDGAVAFSDTSARQPAVFYRAALLARRLAQGPCGLPR